MWVSQQVGLMHTDSAAKTGNPDMAGRLVTSFLLAGLVAAASCKSGSEGGTQPSESGKASTEDPGLAPTRATGAGANSLSMRIEGGAMTEPRELVLCTADAQDPDAVLELAGEHYRQGDFSKANACAQLATDLVPQAVEAQHLRAAALIGLSRYDEAQVAFAMALVLDPDDPETLADVADFFINILPPKRRNTVEVGLQYARRGGQRAVARRRPDRKLQGRLLLLEAEALNDLGDPEGALVRAEEALELVPNLTRAKHELAVSYFNMLRFEESEGIFLRLLSSTPSDAYAHHHLGLIYEHRGRVDDAEAHFQRARDLAPDEFWMPVILSKAQFATEVDSALGELPEDLATLMKGVKVELADVPALADLQASNPPFTPTILGLYRGLPAGVKVEPPPGETATPVSARTLIIYRKNLGRSVHSLAELRLQIRRTLRHEVGHLQGYDEDQLRRLGLE